MQVATFESQNPKDMKPLKTIAIGAVIIFTLCFATLISQNSVSKPLNTIVRGDGFAVLELFTSEGCSSCPPADELVARIQQEYGNSPVYVLAYHVDYWNRLGWKDRFSKPEFSKRQYQYSRQLNAQIYTPQLVINGKREFVGSDAPAIKGAVKAALESKSATTLSLRGELRNGKVNISYQVNGGAADQLLLAVVQKHAISKITNGENDGRTLGHVQIVRELYTFNIQNSGYGSQKIPLPVGYNVKEWEIIGLLQNSQTGVIENATRSKIGGVVSILKNYYASQFHLLEIEQLASEQL